jgi:ATP-dependent Lhr-like helicase
MTSLDPQLLPPSVIRDWFEAKFPEPTLPQAAAWPKIQAGRNVLIVSPTGTGKTLAAFLAVLNQLALEHESGGIPRGIHALYISPLRALSYDLEKNLKGPLREAFTGEPPIRVALRTGDTSPNDRQKQWAKPPHILLTTPESLCLLLSQSKWLPWLRTVRWLIVDEIHALAENKRGSHLSLSMERLAELKGQSPQRIGLSATVAPLQDVAKFLVGTQRDCEIVDATGAKKVDLQVYSPLGSNPYPV